MFDGLVLLDGVILCLVEAAQFRIGLQQPAIVCRSRSFVAPYLPLAENAADEIGGDHDKPSAFLIAAWAQCNAAIVSHVDSSE